MAQTEPDSAHVGDRWWAVQPLLLLPFQGKTRLLSSKAKKRLIVTNEIAQFVLMAQHGYAKETSEPPFGWSEQTYRAVSTTLASHGFLVNEPDSTDADGPWRHWGPFAWAYFEATCNPSKPDVHRDTERCAATRPSSFRSFADAPILLLPRLAPRTDKSFIDVLEQRRTHRHFRDQPVGLEAFSDILRYSFGPLRFADAGPMGVLQLRAAASGGARHETEAFVYVFNVESVSPGLYAYDGLRHGLVLIRPGELREEIDDLTLDQGFFRHAAFGVFTVAFSDRMSWKYHQPGALRIMWQNAGHMAQVFAMMCTSLDLGASLTGAILIGEAGARLNLQAKSELVTFAMACGHPELNGEGLPTSVRVPIAPFIP